MSQKPNASSKERLLAAAKELFAERGFDSTTIAAVAQYAHTSQSQILKHFKDKNGLLQAILSEGWQPLNSAIRLATARIPVPADQLKLILDMLLSYLAQNGGFARVFLRLGDRLQETDPGTREFTEILDGVFEWMMAMGELSPGISPLAMRIGLMGALRAMLAERVLSAHGASFFSESELRTVFSNFLSSCTSASLSQVSALIPEQKDEQPWLNHYLELADMALRASTKTGQA
jgi:AcrR family transcriptional regulator